MSIKTKYFVKSIESFQCKEWLLYKHYAKRIPPIEYSFGLYLNEKLVGVVTYGTPMSNNLRNAFKYRLIELNRLCTNDDLDKNALSFFVSKSLKMLPTPLIVISYADTAFNHHGYIYQATNFMYTGLSAKRTDWKIKGMEHKHSSTIADMSRGKKDRGAYMREKFGNDFYLQQRSLKHRYIYLIGNKKETKKMRESLPYKEVPYPKGDNKNYDASYKTTTQKEMFF